MVGKKGINNVSIIGVGFQGAQIAFRNALYQKKVLIFDISSNKIEKAYKKMEDWLNKCEKKGKISTNESESFMKRIKHFDNLEDCLKDSDLIIEAVPEKLELKQRLWDEIDELASRTALLTSNSSSFKSSSIGKNIKRKDKTFNINFMAPIRDDLVEVMWNNYTSEGTKEVVMEYLNSLKLVPIVTNKEIKGFSQNRVWRAIKKEALRLWAKGYCSYEDLDRAFMLQFNTNIGPFGLMDIIGLDVVMDIEISYYDESKDETDKPPKGLLKLVQEGHLGVKTGRGFYEYPKPRYLDHAWLYKKY